MAQLVEPVGRRLISRFKSYTLRRPMTTTEPAELIDNSVAICFGFPETGPQATASIAVEQARDLAKCPVTLCNLPGRS